MSATFIAPLPTFVPDDGVLEIVGVSGDDDSSHRLSELGFCAGNRALIIKTGDPAIVAIDGTRFALARALQDRIFARPVRDRERG